MHSAKRPARSRRKKSRLKASRSPPARNEADPCPGPQARKRIKYTSRRRRVTVYVVAKRIAVLRTRVAKHDHRQTKDRSLDYARRAVREEFCLDDFDCAGGPAPRAQEEGP